MAKPDTWMPFYVGDYLGDTMHLSRDEHGAYMLLIMAYWMNGGPLPDDEVTLSAITKSTLDEWQRSLNGRCRAFFQIRDGKWHHKRIDEEIQKAIAFIEQKKRAGRASANARTNARSTYVPTATPTEGQRKGNPSPSPSPVGEVSPTTPQPGPDMVVIKQPSAKERVLMTHLPPQIDTPAFREAWRDWIEHRWQKRAPLTEMAAKQQVRDCAALGAERAIAKIRHSLSQGYTGLFEPNGNLTKPAAKPAIKNAFTGELA